MYSSHTMILQQNYWSNFYDRNNKFHFHASYRKKRCTLWKRIMNNKFWYLVKMKLFYIIDITPIFNLCLVGLYNFKYIKHFWIFCNINILFAYMRQYTAHVEKIHRIIYFYPDKFYIMHLYARNYLKGTKNGMNWINKKVPEYIVT